MVKTEKSYKELKQQLDEIIQAIRQDDVDLDEALELHKQGKDILKKLESYLSKAEQQLELEQSA